MDIATLGLTINNEQAVQAARQTGEALDQLAAKGTKTAATLATSGGAVSQAVMKQAVDYTQLTARVQDFARAGATAEQVAQMTGVTMAQATAAVKQYAGTVAAATIDVEGLKAAQAQLTLAGIAAGEAQQVASTGVRLHGLQLGRLNQELGTAIGRMLGVNSAATRLGAQVGGAVAGYGEMIVALAAIGGLMWIWDKMTEGARKAREEQERLTQAAEDWYDTERRGVAGEKVAQLQALQAQLDVLTASYQRLKGAEDAAAGGLGATEGSVAFGAAATSSTNAMTPEMARMQATRAALLADIQRTQRQFFMDQAQQQDEALAKSVAYFRADATLRAQAVARMKDLEGQIAYLRAKHPEDLADINAMMEAVQRFQSALNGKDTSAAQVRENRAIVPQAMIDLVKRYDEYLKQAAKDAKDARKNALDLLAAGDQLLLSTAAKTIHVARPAGASAEVAEQYKILLRDMQRDFAGFFDSILTKGVASFRDLFVEIKNMFLKMLADMAAADVMKKMAPALASMIGMPLPAGTQAPGWMTNHPELAHFGKVAGEGAGMAFAGFQVGSAVGGTTTNSVLGALGGAASGAATGAAIGAMGGPIGMAAGAIIGGAAGLVGGFLGAKHAASQVAAELLKMQAAMAQVGATLADWKAQVTGLASDQKAAAVADLRWKYLSIRQTIEQVEAGKKMADQRNKDLAEADAIYAEAQKKLADQTNALTAAFTGAVNAVNGYRYQSLIYGAMPITPPPATGGGSSGGTGGGTGGSGTGHLTAVRDQGSLTVNVVLPDGTVLGKAVLKSFKTLANQQYGDSTKWGSIQ